MGENRSLSNGQEGNVPKLRFPGFEGEWEIQNSEILLFMERIKQELRKTIL